MTYRKRKRIDPTDGSSVLLGSYRDRDPNTGYVYPTHFGHQYISMSNRHNFRYGEFTEDELHPGPPYRSGGEFKSVKIASCLPFTVVSSWMEVVRPDGQMVFTGGFPPPMGIDFGYDLVVEPLDLTLSSASWLAPSMTGLGQRAWNATKPHIEKAGAAVFLAELRDLPQMLKTTSGYFHDQWKQTNVLSTSNVSVNSAYAMTPKKAADQFINHHFGWAPFVNDLSKFYDTMSRMDEIVGRLSRQNGQYVRRRMTLQDGTVTTKIAEGNGCKLWPNSSFDADTRWSGTKSWFIGGGATWELYDVLLDSIKAVGKFYFYRPAFDTSLPDYTGVFKTLQRRAEILGLRINPSNVYKATPWSWAADWVSNLGDHVDHLNDILSDSIACEYAFVTRHTRRVRRFVQKLPFASGTVTLIFDRLVDVKQRKGALSPYGFDLSLSDLSLKQLTIAGALGISRSSVAR